MLPEAATERLRHSNVAGLIYTTPSHSADAPRWRALCPRHLVVGPESEVGAKELLAAIFPAKAEDVEFLTNKLMLLVEPRIEGRR